MTETEISPIDLLRVARVHPIETGNLTRIPVHGFSPFMMFVAVGAGCLMILLFAYPITAGVCSPNPVPMPLTYGACATAFLVALLFAFRRYVRIADGCQDLVIDEIEKSVALPNRFGRKSQITIPIDQIREVTIAESVPESTDFLDWTEFGGRRYRKRDLDRSKDAPDAGHRSEAVFAVVLYLHDYVDNDGGDPVEQMVPIVAWSGIRRARALALWLRDRLNTG